MKEAKDKAKELVEKMYNEIPVIVSFQNDGGSYDDDAERRQAAKQCALIAVEEIVCIVPRYDYGQGERYDSTKYEYWQSVKQEITNL